MIYYTNRKNYCDFKIFEENKLPARSYFIPFATVTEASHATILKRRYASSKVKCLNGEWDFAYFAKHKDLPTNLDTNAVEFNKIAVPSCWQQLGYEPPFYTNRKFPFPVVPPKIPTKKSAGKYGDDINGIVYPCGRKQYNSVGVYKTTIKLENLKKHYIISFLGVAGALELYLNGKYVGYSEGAHNTAEFDLDSFIVAGDNELLAIVHKWSNGSYLEDQDMFRNNGIFRDVLLYINEPTFVWDFDFFTIKRGESYDAYVNVKVCEPSGATLTVTLSDRDKKLAIKSAEAMEDTNFACENLTVTEWNSEEPKLYDLTITLRQNGVVTECINKNVGFTSIDIANRCYLFNGKKIKMRGVNHHDTNPKTGYYNTPEQMEYDVRIFKDYNINTVRTSHYPPDPMFIELCDFYGIYVVDEADIETHGTINDLQISNATKWKNHFWDRVSRMYYRDRNSCSIAMWSLGNESGGIKCQNYCYKLLKELTPIPIHYERASVFKQKGMDVISEMYTTPDGMKNKLEGACKMVASHKKAFAKMPFFLCEYAHAMGVGAGDLEDYWDVIYSHDNAIGGCIWEFADHAIYHEDAKYKYTYGGDHGEYTHDSNFCVDGLFTPDRKPHTGALSMKNIYRPVMATLLNKTGLIEFKNYNNFRTTEYLAVKGYFVEDGEKTGAFEFKLRIAPNDTESINLHLDNTDKDAFINLEYYDGKHLVATEQLVVNEKLMEVKLPTAGAIKIEKIDDLFLIKLDNGVVKFNSQAAAFIGYKIENKEYFAEKPIKSDESGVIYTNIYRAPIDNDMYIKKQWHRVGYDNLTKKAVDFKYVTGDNFVQVSCQHLLLNKDKKALFSVSDVYTVESNGMIALESVLTPLLKGLPMLPRVGKILELKKEYADIIYYGRGAEESYPDFKAQAQIGVYKKNIKDFMFPYIRPQESGNRTDCRYAVIRNRAGDGIMLLADKKPFNFGAKRYTDSALEAAGHQEDLEIGASNYINVDSEMLGVGSNSCGALTSEPFQLAANKQYTTSFKIIPFTSIKDSDIL